MRASSNVKNGITCAEGLCAHWKRDFYFLSLPHIVLFALFLLCLLGILSASPAFAQLSLDRDKIHQDKLDEEIEDIILNIKDDLRYVQIVLECSSGVGMPFEDPSGSTCYTDSEGVERCFVCVPEKDEGIGEHGQIPVPVCGEHEVIVWTGNAWVCEYAPPRVIIDTVKDIISVIDEVDGGGSSGHIVEDTTPDTFYVCKSDSSVEFRNPTTIPTPADCPGEVVTKYACACGGEAFSPGDCTPCEVDVTTYVCVHPQTGAETQILASPNDNCLEVLSVSTSSSSGSSSTSSGGEGDGGGGGSSSGGSSSSGGDGGSGCWP